MVAEHATPHVHSAVEPPLTLRRRLDIVARAAMPSVFIVLCTVALSAPFGLPGQAELQFGIAMSTVWFWAVARPRSMPAFAVFLCGIVFELFSSGPPGAVLLWMLIIYGVAYHWRYGLSHRGFLLSWLVYGILVIVASFFEWALVCVHGFALLSPVPSLFQAALTVGLHPTISAVFVWGRRVFANPDHA